MATDRHVVLDSLVNVHNQSGNFSAYRVYHQGSISHIIPGTVNKQGGNLSGVGSVLDTRIIFPQQDRSLYELVTLVLQMLTAKTGVRILIAQAEMNSQCRTLQGGDNITARDALIRAFASHAAESRSRGFALAQLTWALLYQADQKNVLSKRPRSAARWAIPVSTQIRPLATDAR